MKSAQNTLKRFFSNRFTFVWFMLLLMINHKVQAQDLQIQLGNTQIALNEAFTITITLQNENIRRYTNFPDIKGFQKRGTSSSSNTSFINGKMSMSTAITQTYVPLKEGKYNLPAFKMQVNEKEATHPGASLKVGPAKQQAAQDPFGADPFGMDPFEEFFGGGRNTPREYIEVADDAFFAITTNKNKVYVGEGFTMTIAV